MTPNARDYHAAPAEFDASSAVTKGKGYSSYGSGYLSYAKVGQCGCVVAGSGTTV